VKGFLLILSVLGLTACPALVAGDEISKIDRVIGKEPTYRSKPKYCLVVLGPEAKSRVWLVRDGDLLYVDRQGNGDLTGKDQSVAKEFLLRGTVFQVGTIPARHGAGSFSLEVQVMGGVEKEARYEILCQPEAGKGHPQRTVGVLLFGDKPAEAPIVHFGGPLTLTILDWHKPLQAARLRRGDQANELSILLGTPVFGGKHQAFATVDKGLPGLPVVEMAFPGKDPGVKPITTRAAVRH
jgi:hypothetical protein